MLGTADPLVAALDAINEPSRGGKPLKVVELFGDRPDVLDAIVRMRARGLSFRQIADAITANGHPITEGAINKWLSRQ